MTAFNGSVGRFRKIVVLLKAVRLCLEKTSGQKMRGTPAIQSELPWLIPKILNGVIGLSFLASEQRSKNFCNASAQKNWTTACKRNYGASLRIAFQFVLSMNSSQDSGYWYRAYGNEQWEFADNGLMRRREASINDVPIQASNRKFR